VFKGIIRVSCFTHDARKWGVRVTEIQCHGIVLYVVEALSTLAGDRLVRVLSPSGFHFSKASSGALLFPKYM
jgi:hypothetical protein